MLYRSALLFLMGGVTIRPYVPPNLDPDPLPDPSAVKVVEITPPNDSDWDANVLARPQFTAPLAGQVARGAKIAVRGELHVENARGCGTRLYYALEPFGWICSSDVRPSGELPTKESVLQLVDDTPVPYRYVMVGVEEGTFLPMWGSLEDLRGHMEPERQLKRGDTIALGPKIERFEDESYYISVDEKVVPVKGTFTLKSFSDWQGIELKDDTRFPFAWVTIKKAPVYDAPKGTKIDTIDRRERIDLLEEQTIGSERWLRIGDGRWMKSGHLNEVRKHERPEGTGDNPQWIDVDLGEQVAVAYIKDKPVYATLTSSGREPNHSPRGNYPIWGKVAAITMKSQEYDDIPYYVNRVPWVLFFQAHNALHGAYWHDLFGSVKSHGCVNLAPKDARYLFDWIALKLPPGWTAVRYWDLTQAPVVHVHNSSKPKDFFQERNIGPPDKNDEQERLDKAIARREAKEREEALAAQGVQGAAATPGSLVVPSGTQGVPALQITPSGARTTQPGTPTTAVAPAFGSSPGSLGPRATPSFSP